MVWKTINQSASEGAYRNRSVRSQEQFERAARSMPGGAKGAYFYPPYPLTFERAEGCHLYDVDGHAYVDFANHHTSQILGHGHPAVVDAVQRQLARGIAVGGPMGVETALADEICRRIDSIDQIRFCNSGTEATLHAIRLARGFTGRSKIAKFEGAYHGSHDAVEISVAPPVECAGSAGAPRSVPSTGGISPQAPGEVVVMPYDNEEAVERLVAENRNELACVLFDPKVGMYQTRPAFAQALRRITQQQQVLLVFDEIVSFRVGSGGYQESCQVRPDLTTLGKIIGGGFPVGGVGGRADIMRLFDNSAAPTGFGQSGTFSAHPITMVAGLATLEQLDAAAFQHLNACGERLRKGLQQQFNRVPEGLQIVGQGSLFSIYFSSAALSDYRAVAEVDRDPVSGAFQHCLAKGLFLNHNLIMNALSLATGPDEVSRLIAAWEELLLPRARDLAVSDVERTER